MTAGVTPEEGETDTPGLEEEMLKAVLIAAWIADGEGWRGGVAGAKAIQEQNVLDAGLRRAYLLRHPREHGHAAAESA